jgi:hypothetical protein
VDFLHRERHMMTYRLAVHKLHEILSTHHHTVIIHVMTALEHFINAGYEPLGNLLLMRRLISVNRFRVPVLFDSAQLMQ